MSVGPVGGSGVPEWAKVSGEVSADLSAATVRGQCAVLGAEGKFALSSGATQMPFGAFLAPAPTSATSGVQITVATAGYTQLRVNGNSVNIAIGDPLGPDADGNWVKQATDTQWYGAIALEAATADDVYIRCRLVDPTTLAG